MVRRRRFNSWNDWNRLRTSISVPLHPPLSEAELAQGSRTMLRWLGSGAALLVLILALLTARLSRATAHGVAVIEQQLKNPDFYVRERALRVAVRDSLYHALRCSSMFDALVDSSQRVQSAAMPAMSAAVAAGHCTRQLLLVLDSTTSGSDRQRLLQIVSAVGEPLSQVAQRSLLRALEHDSASNGAAAIALARSGSRDSRTIRALHVAFGHGRGIARGEALIALLKLEPQCENIPLVREALLDEDPMMRRLAIESLEPILRNRFLHCPSVRTVIQSVTADTSAEVRAAAFRMLSTIDH